MNSQTSIERIFGTQAGFQKLIAETLVERLKEASIREVPLGKGERMIHLFCANPMLLTGGIFVQCCDILSVDPFSVITSAINQKNHTCDSQNLAIEIYVDYVDRYHSL